MPVATPAVTPTSGPSQIGGYDPAGESISGIFPTFPNSATNGLTAVAGGGQSAAPTITTMITRFTTVASAADSATLPAATVGAVAYISNSAAANSMNVFPLLGGFINALAVNTAFALAAGKNAVFYCAVAGTWMVILSA